MKKDTKGIIQIMATGLITTALFIPNLGYTQNAATTSPAGTTTTPVQTSNPTPSPTQTVPPTAPPVSPNNINTNTNGTSDQKPVPRSSQFRPAIPIINFPAEQQRIEALVKNAAEFIKLNGKDAAIAEFNKKDGSFTAGNTYIFAADYTGILLADPFLPENIGKNQYDLVTEDGRAVVKEAIATAKAGGGWLQYKWKEPVTGIVTCKKSYIMGINDSFLIGSGYYFPADPDGACPPN